MKVKIDLWQDLNKATHTCPLSGKKHPVWESHETDRGIRGVFKEKASKRRR